MTQGHWLHNPQSRDASSFRTWETPGCLTHRYQSADINACLKRTRILIIGDSTSRDIFLAFARKLDPHAAQEMDLLQKHRDLRFEAADVKLEFMWDPFLNSTGLTEELDGFRLQQAPNRKEDKDRPSIMMVGGGLWNVRYQEAEAGLRDFKTSIGQMLDNASWRMENVRVSHYADDLFLVAPVQIPLYEALSPDRKEVMTPGRINPLNEYLRQLSDENGLPVLSVFHFLTQQDEHAFATGGIHVANAVSDWKADVVLNLRCNGLLSARGNALSDGTCCSNYYAANAIEQSLLVIGAMLVSCYVLLACRCKLSSSLTLSAS